MTARSSLAGSAEEAAEYRRLFRTFAVRELASGGPDHHLDVVSRLVNRRELDAMSGAWLVSCYMGPYNVPGGDVIWKTWPAHFDLDAGVTQSGSVGIEEWLRENWSGIPIRKERRPVRSPAKLAKFLRTAHEWCHLNAYDAHEMTFEELWMSTSQIKGLGRYSKMKFLEGLRRSGVTVAEQPDIRAHGGKYTRLGLSHMFPEYDEILNQDGSSRAARKIDALGQVLHRDQFSFIPDQYNFEVLLCTYRQGLAGKYYPGRPLDSELEQIAQVQRHFGYDATEIFSVRDGVFPHEHLGEMSGWPGRREEIGKAQRHNGWDWWSDLEFDYVRTEDPTQPVRRDS